MLNNELYEFYELYELVLDFVKQTVINIESSTYNILSHINSEKIIKNFQQNLCKCYYNDIYKALITNSNGNGNNENNENIENKLSVIMNMFPNTRNCNYLCLLNILYNLTINVILNANRTNYNTSSHNQYIESVQIQITQSELFEYEHVKKTISEHKFQTLPFCS